MIDTAAILIFSSLIVYTVIRAIKLDKLLPWFSDHDPAPTSAEQETRK